MPTHYLQIAGQDAEVWAVDETSAQRIRPREEPIEVRPGESVIQALRRICPAWVNDDGNLVWHKLKLAPDQCHPRIARPPAGCPDAPPGWPQIDQAERAFVVEALSQLSALYEQLSAICRTVHPIGDNMRTFGHDIRNVLILAATEVEMHWKGVLAKNGYARRNLSTNEYVWLDEAMQLGGYRVRFPLFPTVPEITPFAGWSTLRPTQSLSWYAAYNATKHDREAAFSFGTLQHAFEAVAGCFVMLAAQFGNPEHLNKQVGHLNFMHLVAWPKWGPEYTYVWPPFGDQWEQVNYPWPAHAAE